MVKNLSIGPPGGGVGVGECALMMSPVPAAQYTSLDKSTWFGDSM